VGLSAVSDLRIDVVAHDELTPNLLGDLRRLFDDEYFDQFGVWSPEQPYG
jgi:aminoglycoside 2'-N-acetyltransferase I